MRAAFGLLTALPLDWDPEDVGDAWGWTAVVGVVLGVAWLLFHRTFVALGGPFVAAGLVLLLHQALIGARPLRGLAAVVGHVVHDPGDDRSRALPDASGAGAAAVTLVLLAMAGFVTLLDVAPAALVLVPLIGRAAQVLLLGPRDDGVGVRPPTPGQRGLVVVGVLVATALPPALVPLIRPARLGLTPAEYLLAGVVALVASVAVGLLARAWVRARLGELDADAWYAVGAVTDLTALAAVVVAVT